MSIHAGIGFSQHPNPTQAAREAVNQAKMQANQLSTDLAIIFSTIHYSTLDVAMTIRQILPDTKIIGTSTAGIIMPDFIADRGIAALTITSEHVKYAIGAADNMPAHDIRQLGTHLAKETMAELGAVRRQAFILFTDGLTKNSFHMLNGLQESFGNAFPIVGAGSSDDFHFKKTYQFYQEKLMTSSACGVLLGGQMNIGVGSQHGWKPLGKPRIIDKVDGVVIKTIDGHKASRIYEEYFAQETRNLYSTKLGKMAILYPLGIFLPDEHQFLIRNAVDILSDGSIICQGEVPEGSEVHIMIGNKEYCQQAAVDAAQEARAGLYGKPPKLVLIFESLSRYKLLGRQAFKEIQLIKEVFGQNVPIIGMYSYGELAPLPALNNSKKTHLQNESIVILAIE